MRNFIPRVTVRVLLFILTIGFVCGGMTQQLTAQQKRKPAKPAKPAVKKKELPPAAAFTIPKAPGRIKIDGHLKEEAWQSAVKIEMPYEIKPGDNIPAPVKTECLMMYTRSWLYIGFRCSDPDPKKIRAHLMNRDALATFLQDDYVGIVLDTFNDERRAFVFRSNAMGVQNDSFYDELRRGEDISWDAIWNSAGKITDYGYSVEMAIHFNQLRFPKDKEKQTWGVSLERSYPRSVRHEISSHPVNRRGRCYLCQVNKVAGFEKMSAGHNIEIAPTLTLNRTDQIETLADPDLKSGKTKVDPGVTARWGITPNVILNATVNPDFSHVEADAAQLEINTRFALQYPEKRPFFLEGADIFRTPMDMMFTRSVVDPVWGVKLTGKEGKSAFGVFAAQDRFNNLIFPSNAGSWRDSFEEDTYGGVVRYRRDVGKGSSVGALYTGRTSGDYYNHVFGVDSLVRLSRTNYLTLQAVGSQTRYPGDVAAANDQQQGNFGGKALYAKFAHYGRNLQYGLTYQDLSTDFRADYGYQPRVDIRGFNVFIHPLWYGKRGGWFTRINMIMQASRYTDTEGTLTDQNIQLGFRYGGPLQSIFTPVIHFNKEYYFGVTYKQTLYQVYYEIIPTNGVLIWGYTRFGDGVDYVNRRLADRFYTQLGLDVGLGKHLNVSLLNTYEKLRYQGDKIYSINLLQANLIYNFNVRTFIRAMVQYNNTQRNPELYYYAVSPETKRVFTQFLFSYKINPQTVLFLGYSDNHYGRTGLDILRTDRTFFLKIGYALTM